MVYDILKNIWHTPKTNGIIPSARSGCKTTGSITAISQEIYLFGGYALTNTKQSEYFNDLYVYNILNATWKQIMYKDKKATPPKRTDHSLNFYDNCLYVFGGKGEA